MLNVKNFLQLFKKSQRKTLPYSNFVPKALFASSTMTKPKTVNVNGATQSLTFNLSPVPTASYVGLTNFNWSKDDTKYTPEQAEEVCKDCNLENKPSVYCPLPYCCFFCFGNVDCEKRCTVFNGLDPLQRFVYIEKLKIFDRDKKKG